MIRGLLVLLALVAGLAAAALVVGRMHHLRLAFVEDLPPWSVAVADDAGVLNGRALLPAGGRWPKTDLTWHARAPSRTGWVWDVALTGDGVDVHGQVTLSYWSDEALLTEGAGTLDLGRLRDLPVPVEGILRIEEATGTANGLFSDPVFSATAAGRVPALRIAGADAGAGPASGVLEGSGAWRAEARLDGGVTGLKAVVAAEGIGAVPVLDLAIADGDGLPPALRAMLSAAAEPDGAGWRLTVPLSNR